MSLSIVDLGRIYFKDAFQRQVYIHSRVKDKLSPHTLILCEHPHTFTVPRKLNLDNIIDISIAKREDIDFVVGLNRGGDITYHGPGQLMGYLIFDLKALGIRIGDFLNSVELALIKTMFDFGISCGIIPGFRGIWTNGQKIASIGLGFDNWVSLHGFALNINTDLSFFDMIRPCGLNVKMTSMEGQLNNSIDTDMVKIQIIQHISEVFGYINEEKVLHNQEAGNV
jgi:lipoate-protein ligase B